MYNIFYAIVIIVWLFYIFNFPFMTELDTTYPINGWVWLIILLVVDSVYDKTNKKNKEGDNDEV